MVEHRGTVSLLLVEDSRHFAELIGEFLSMSDAVSFDVTTVATLSEAKSQLESSQPDMVLSDLRLPDADADQLFDWIAKTSPSVPIVLMTGLMDPRLRQRALEAGCLDCVDKDDLVTISLGDSLVGYLAAYGADGRT